MKKHVKQQKTQKKNTQETQSLGCKFGASLLQTCTKLAPADSFFEKKHEKS